MTTIWFIRHAESKANAGLPTFLPEGIELTAKGFKQAEQIAHAFTEEPRLIVTSSYIRTQQTALPSIERFPECHQEEWPVHEFTYLSPSRNQHTTIEERRPLVCEYWERQNPFYVDGEGAETFFDFMSRVQSIMEHLAHFEEDFIAIFSHEQFILAVLWTLLFGPTSADNARSCMKRFRSFLKLFSMPNGSIVQIQLQTGKEPLFSRITASHLPEYVQV